MSKRQYDLSIGFWYIYALRNILPRQGEDKVEKSVHTDQYKFFVSELRKARLEAGLTQEQLAERLQPTSELRPQEARRMRSKMQGFVSLYENRERRLDILEVHTICRALGVSFIEFMKKLDAAWE